MKSIVFDTGPIISLTMNNLVWTLRHLKRQYRGRFYITESVKAELIDRPLESKRFKLEALQTLYLLRRKVITVLKAGRTRKLANQLLDIANDIYYAKGHPIRIVHFGEVETLAAAMLLGSDAVVIDERTTRKLIEEPMALKDILERKLHTPVTIRQSQLRLFRQKVSVKVLRSVELMVMAFELGLLDPYLPKTEHPRQTLLEAALWALKLNGCAVSDEEIQVVLAQSRKQR